MKHKLIPIEISKNISDRVIDLAIYKNHYVLIKKLDVFLGDHNKKYICRQCLSSYTSENMLMKHKEKCKDGNITVIKTSNESHLHWKKHFHKNPLYFRIYADFEADNEEDNTCIGNKTTNIFKQNPVLNGYYIISELEDVLKSDYYQSPLGYDNVDWFVDEVIILENKMAFYFKNTKKDIIMTEENEEDFRNNNICRFCEKEILSDKVRDHCHLTSKYRGPAHSKCNINVTQKQSNFIPFIFHNFSIYDCHMFFKKLVDKKKDKVDFEIIPKTNEEYISVTYGCIRFIDSYRFLSSGLDSLVKNLDEDDFKILKKEFPDKWQYLNKKLAYPYEYFNSIDDYKKPVHINIISFRQSKWLEKYINFNTQKRNQAVNDFEKDFYKLLNNAFYGKTMENVRNRLKIKFVKKDDYREIVKQQSKLTFNGIHKSYENCDSYTFKQNEVLMDKPIYLGFTVLELSKLLMYETYYDKLQAYFGQENIQLHYIDTDAFVLSLKTQDIITDSKNLEDIFDFSNLDKNHELFSNKNKKVLGKYKIETPKSAFIDEFVCLRSKMYAFKCGNDSKNKLKGISKSQSKNIKFEEYKKCLDGEEYQQECDNYIIRSINHEMVLQEIKKNDTIYFR